jgi:hypothetical protein
MKKPWLIKTIIPDFLFCGAEEITKILSLQIQRADRGSNPSPAE